MTEQQEAGELCPQCTHDFDEHVLVAPGSPLDGGTYYCQLWPECLCSGTWDVDAPEEIKASHRAEQAEVKE
jgi:hypothetical protein